MLPAIDYSQWIMNEQLENESIIKFLNLLFIIIALVNLFNSLSLMNQSLLIQLFIYFCCLFFMGAALPFLLLSLFFLFQNFQPRTWNFCLFFRFVLHLLHHHSSLIFNNNNPKKTRCQMNNNEYI
jgi:hypothetical protein